MRLTILIPAIFYVLFVNTLQAQDNYYWITFKDKQHNAFSLSQPNAFLSDASVERRLNHGVSLDETDLPISQFYIDGISPFIHELKHRLKWFNMVVVRVSNPAYIDSLKALSYVDSVGVIENIPPLAGKREKKFEEAVAIPDQLVRYPNKYGIAFRQTVMLNTDLVHQMGYNGQNIRIAVMDNGFYNVHQMKAFDSIRQRILYTYDFVNHEADVYNDGGHGTNVLSCMAANMPNAMYGTAPGASYCLFTTEDDNREWVMEEYNWAAAAEAADSLGATLFNTSLGYTRYDNSIGSHTYSEMDGKTTLITRAANRAAEKGILVVNSAGNSGASQWYYISAPADGEKVLAVGAVDSTGKIANFSSRGPNAAGTIKPDLCAQGVRSAVVTIHGDLGFNGGTSFSSPILAGSIASLWSAFPGKTANQLKEALLASADKFLSPDSTYGYGIPNLYNAFMLLIHNFSKSVLPSDNQLLVHPNPFQNSFRATILSENDGWNDIELYSMNGEKILARKVYSRAKTYLVTEPIETTDLPVGSYILRLNGEKKFTRLLIKQR